MYQRKVHAQTIRNPRRPFCPSRIWAHNHATLHSTMLRQYPLLDILPQQMPSVQVVDWDVEETLVLRVMQVHSDDVVSSRASQEVGNEGAGLSDPLFVAALRFEVWWGCSRGVC